MVLLTMMKSRKLAQKNKPKLIIAGASAYSSKIDFKLFREIADEINAYLLVDVAHYSGLIASGCYPDPLPFADVCTSTTHKTLRGPRGGIILSNNLDLGKKIDKAVFPRYARRPFNACNCCQSCSI